MKLKIIARVCVPFDDLMRNERYCAGLGLKRLGAKVGAEPLAVVGSGPSVSQYAECLRNWRGGIWAINGAWKWCADNGIEADFFSVDPQPAVAELVSGVKKAYLASSCHPSVFDALRDADVTVFDIMQEHYGGETRIANGPTSASTVPHVALRAGFREITFFGCEGSFTDPGKIRVHGPSAGPFMQVKCGDNHFLTDPEFCMQSEWIAAYINAVPSLYSEKSGGLLRALVSNPEWDVIAMSKSMRETITGELEHANP